MQTCALMPDADKNAWHADGGAIFLEGSSSSLSLENNFFVDNRQHELLGASVSQRTCDPGQIRAVNNAIWQSPETLEANTGCDPIQVVGQ